MAEVLSVVASGIAVGQAAQTVGQAVFSLIQLWREVKDAPETVQNMLDDLEVAGELVAAIEAELETSALSTGPNSSRCLTRLQELALRRCRQIQKKLGDFVEDLAADIASSRKKKRLLAKAQVVLKKETLASYEKRLEKALASLNATLQLNLIPRKNLMGPVRKRLTEFASCLQDGY
ncbi:hypothetical protein NEMBOFW57_002763 [Staphylotrichum longicolle]|uniref:NACHT-NTPase and P-loop NTPases N-terminal domain-containing protein n=1 Tax=Staphylotrichum longicolle TaxID=669026 RepID=A0AAD4F433_9PEZI|nr:hypothetical protein NEMBOFW57_002763 [Staphylotrichum longicolle]